MYNYPCPGCRSTNVLHGRDCRFEDQGPETIETAHVQIIAALTGGERRRDELRTVVRDQWDELFEATLQMLIRDSRIETTHVSGGEALELIPPDEIADRIEPTEDPIRTVYEFGSVPGAHDNSVFAMVSYYASKGLSWDDTKRQVVNWLHESGTWARGGFEEPTPEALVEDKRHVHREGYGWLEKATAAKRVIDESHLASR